jgi:hypothetical protein
MKTYRFLPLMLVILVACSSTIYPESRVMRAPLIRASIVAEQRLPWNVMVLGENQAVVNRVSQLLGSVGGIVIDQRVTAASDQDALKTGQRIGADLVVFVDASVKSTTNSLAFFHPSYGGGYSSRELYHASVTIRGVYVETGEVGWSGSAWYPKPINNPEQGIIHLTENAFGHAFCRYQWSNRKGCHQG